jgi:hypothetical protein
MAEKKWFQEGAAGRKMAEQKAKEQKLRYESQLPWTFRVDVGARVPATFLDDAWFYLNIHDVQLPGDKFYTPVTCIQDVDTCPVCVSSKLSSYVLITTILNHSKYKTKKGEELQHYKQLAMFKGTALTNLQYRREDLKGSIKFHCFKFARGKEKECRTGSDITYFKKFTPANMKLFIPKDIISDTEKAKDFLAPYNYEKLFAPKSIEELSAIAGTPVAQGAAEAADPFSEEAGSGEAAQESCQANSAEDLFND